MIFMNDDEEEEEEKSWEWLQSNNPDANGHIPKRKDKLQNTK